MAAWRCNTCKIKFPASFSRHVGGKECPSCERRLEYLTNGEADKDWQDKLDASIMGVEECDWEPESALPWPSPHPENDSAPIIYRNDVDRVEVTHQTLRNLGYNPEPFDVVRLNGKYYELLDYHSGPQTWTIERFDFDKTKRQIKRLPVYRKPKYELTFELMADSETEAQDS